MKIGLVGGSFNPPHEGHIHISKTAKQKLNLDAVWWLVTPQNPLKKIKTGNNYEKRIKESQKLTKNYPYIIISDIEQQIASTNTYQTVKYLKKLYPYTKFTWIGGTDLLKDFHKWNNYQFLLKEIDFVFIKRPPNQNIIKATKLSLYRKKIFNIKYLLNQKTINQSSTNIRSLNSKNTKTFAKKSYK